MARSLAHRAVLATLTAFLGLFMVASPASAHEDGESEEGYLLIQQALGHLAHDTSAEGIDLAMEKVEDALDTEDQEGVDVPQLEQGMAALEAGEVARARSLLQESITEALQSLPPATGGQTGTTEVSPELPGREDLRPQDWGFLAVSTLALLVGLWLAYRFRPHDPIRTLRSLLGPAPNPAAAGSAHGQEGR